MTLRGTYLTKGQIIVLVIILFIAIAAFALLIWQGSQSPQSSVTENITAATQVKVMVPIEDHVMVSMSAGEVIFSPGDMTVFIPSGAVDISGKVVFTRREADLLSEVGLPGWRRPYVVNIEFQDELNNILDVVINRPVEVCFILDEQLWAEYLVGVPFQVEVYDESTSPPVWTSLPLYTYPNHYQLCGTTNHFSLFALAVNDVSVPEPTATETPGLYEP